MVTGQAAGTAAALCVKENLTPRTINPLTLKEILVKQGVVV
jgi:hypothetical protein